MIKKTDITYLLYLENKIEKDYNIITECFNDKKGDYNKYTYSVMRQKKDDYNYFLSLIRYCIKEYYKNEKIKFKIEE